MQTATALKRQTKDTLVAQLLETAKERHELKEQVIAAAVIGGVAGMLLGTALATM